MKIKISALKAYIKMYFMLVLNGFLCGLILMMAFSHNYNGGIVDYWMKGTAIAAVTLGLGHWELDFSDIKELGLKRFAVNIMGILATLTPYIVFKLL